MGVHFPFSWPFEIAQGASPLAKPRAQPSPTASGFTIRLVDDRKGGWRLTGGTVEYTRPATV